jgi:hypothetical protein
MLLSGLEVTATKLMIQQNLCPGRHSNREPEEYKSEVARIIRGAGIRVCQYTQTADLLIHSGAQKSEAVLMAHVRKLSGNSLENH